ncbi:MAG TPA: bifunctional phosphoribosyl-AMP cyclohydrolase/phosphoribosyl-ATP diphosphatase HisIE [Pyrinomonadaceae bacterium]|jgi:phosphoribosyl-ATP pyrophosphohydrolase/phosphoribosyl-AMP cyclohydrolase|nr:bifunctional phosphoribosyl-AMP cyclohydrolase/phosphoribosyl-ATP diphosphatase HisIE [Pyrinomonadaceae bacterium]
MKIDVANVKFNEQGLLPAVVQDATTRQVLMLAYMNRESLERTLADGETWFWSRSRKELWRKGATSGNTQRVVEIRLDCDADALVVLVETRGPACHTGAVSCFAQEDNQSVLFSMTAGGAEQNADLGETLSALYELIEGRRRELPEGSYTTYLFTQGLDKILKKIGEEAAETIIAAKNAEAAPLVAETTDLLYHLLVLLVERGVALDSVRRELELRRQKR